MGKVKNFEKRQLGFLIIIYTNMFIGFIGKITIKRKSLTIQQKQHMIDWRCKRIYKMRDK